MDQLNKKAFSVVEYTVLFVIIIGGFLIMRNYIQGGVFGMWAKSGQSLAYGRQYDAQKTIECGFDGQSNMWYDYNCFVTASQGCNGNASCQEGIMNSTCVTSTCSQQSNGPS